MANLPVIRSREMIFGDMAAATLSRLQNVNDLNSASVLVQFLDAISQINFRSSAALIQMIDALSVDRAVGEALQRLANDNDVPILPGNPSNGPVNIQDVSFQKIFSTIYAGQPAPVAGSIYLYVANASQFAPTGSLYIGRGTPNVEGPLQYTAVTSQGGGAYWQITLNATTLTTNFHNIGEEVVMSQGGNRLINTGATVQTAQGANVTSVSFRTVSPATIQDGEVTVMSVPVVCTVVGSPGNVAAGAITQATGLAFPASVNNPNLFSNGTPPDTDDTLRARIQAYLASKSLGTPLAIQTAAQGVTAPDDQKTVQSASVITYADNSAALVYDDGAGAEPLYAGVGLETVVDVALGGEQDLQLREYPVAQARVQSGAVGPFNIPNEYGLQVAITGVTYTHFFLSTDFAVPGAGTATEVMVSINNDPNFGCYATTANGGTNVVIYPRNQYSNDITVNTLSSNDSNAVLQFPTTINYTLWLYRNNLPLFQDGYTAVVQSLNQGLWSANTVGPTETITYQVDGTPQITGSITTTNFQAINSQAVLSPGTPLSIWAQVLTSVMPGVTVTVTGQTLSFTSNSRESNAAAIYISGGTLLDKIFQAGATIQANGRASDYTLNLNTGQLTLAAPLATNDSVYAGSPFSEANVLSTSMASGPTESGTIWVVVDGDVLLIPNGLQSNTSITYTNVSSNLFTISGLSPLAVPQGFSEVSAGDWILLWTDPGDNISYPGLYNHAGFWRVQSIAGSTITVDVGNNSGYTNGTDSSIPTNRIVIVRTTAPLQVFSFSPINLTDFATNLQTGIDGISTSIIGSAVQMATLTAGSNGQLVIVAADTGGQALGFPIGTIVDSVTSQLGFTVTSDSEAGIPNFNYSDFTAELNDTTYTDPNYLNDGGTYDNFAQILNRYSYTVETLPTPPEFAELPDSNAGRRVLTTNYNPVSQNVTLLVPPYMQNGASPIKAGDRYFLRSAYQFDSTDTTTVIIDGNTISEAYAIEVARKLAVSNWSTPTNQSFSATDLESTLALSSASSFYDFDFSNFKAWRQANTTLTNGTYSLVFTANQFGPSGNRQRVGFVYPASLAQTSLALNVTNSDVIDLGIVIPVTTPRIPNWDGSTSFTTTVTTTGGEDSITFTWRSGTQPNFTTAGVQVGDLCMINGLANFLSADDGIQALVTNVTATTFTVSLPTGTVEADNVTFFSMVNQAGVTTVVTTTPHGIIQGERVGFWNTGAVTGSNYPFNTTYFPTVINSTTFTVPTPPAAPGGTIVSGTWVSDVVTLTIPGHGLSQGDVILVSGVPVTGYNGTYPVYAVLNANQFQYIVAGSGAAVASGRFDFQSYAPNIATTVNPVSYLQSGQVVTVGAGGNFPVGSVVQIVGAMTDAWVSGTPYAVGYVVSYSGLNYISLANGNMGNTPNVSPTWWSVTSATFNGTFTVTASSPLISFQYYVGVSVVNQNGSGGTATSVDVTGSLARSIGSSASLLSFGQIGTTAQQVVSYLTASQPGILAATTTTPSAAISVSTADLQILSDYLSGSVSQVSTIQGSQLVQITVNNAVAPGSTITITITNPTYTGQYVIQSAVQSGGNYILTAQSSVMAFSTGAISGGTGTYTGVTAYQMMQDGENWILSSNLQSTPGVPMFLTKQAWATVPAIGEQVRIVALDTDQLSRFWNELVVTGLSSVAQVVNSEFGTQLQISTETFGSAGSVYCAGGTANQANIALIGSGAQVGTKVGLLTVPYLATGGLNARFWLKLTQTTTQNKALAFDATTVLQVYTDGLAINSGDGTFQVARTTTQDSTTVVQVERHGGFLAFIRIGGTSFGLNSGSTPVQEGDWVKIRNVAASSAWNTVTAYTIGQTVLYTDGYTYAAILANTAVIPSQNPATWQRLGFNVANNGIFQVVRVFGPDSFWVVNPNPVDEVALMSHGSELSFYSYDSVMPGDQLTITGAILGTQNVGTYRVLDELSGPLGTLFPTATRIYTQAIPEASGSGIVLGDQYSQVNILENVPIVLWKRIVTVGPGPAGLANVIVDTPNLMNKLSSSLGAYLTMQGKLAFPQVVEFGINSYEYYEGLIKQLNTVIYGDPTDPINYPGVRAAGTFLSVIPKLILPIAVSLSVRLRSNIAFSDVLARIQSAVAGYVNTLPVGGQVALSEIVNAANSVNGVLSVVLTSPSYTVASDLIAVGQNQQAQILNPSTDVVVSILGTS